MGDDSIGVNDSAAGFLADGPAGRMARFLSSIISAASVQPSGVPVVAAVECRRRPGHRPCPGWIKVKKSDVPSTIEWQCISCNDSGVISHWTGSTADLCRWARDPGEKVLLQMPVSPVELRQLRTMVAEPENPALVAGAVVIDGSILLRATWEDFEDLAGCIAFESNHESSNRRQGVLDGIADRVEVLLGVRQAIKPS